MFNIFPYPKKILVLLSLAFCIQNVRSMPIETTSPYANLPLAIEGIVFNPPNVMLFLDTSGSMRTSVPASKGNRMTVAAEVTRQLFRDNTNVRWGLFTFDNRPESRNNITGWWGSTKGYNLGGILRVPVQDYSATHLSDLITAVNTVEADVNVNYMGTNTPITQAYVEMINYFAGMASMYDKPVLNGTTTNYQSPLQLRCDKNYIMLMTDGEPTEDEYFDTRTLHPILGNLTSYQTAHNSLSDAALRAFEGNLINSFITTQPTIDIEGQPFAGNQLNVRTYTIGFATNQQLLQDTANNGNGAYFTANNQQQLTDAFQQTIQSIIAQTGSNPSPISVSQPSKEMIQVTYDTGSWSGKVISYQLNANGEVIAASAKDARVPAAANRKLLTTYYTGGGSKQVIDIQPTNSTLLADTATFGANPSWTLNFIRGVEPAASSRTWRSRQGNLLGDFINTSAVSFKHGQYFLAGSNDGMVHFFSRPNTTFAFEELFAYAPSATLSKVQHVASQGYGRTSNPHRYLVDGPIVAQDLNLDGTGSEEMIAVGSLGRGGKGLYALNLSKAFGKSLSSINNDVVLWDKNSDHPGDASGWTRDGSNLGYTFAKPVIAKVTLSGTADPVWMTVTGNGFNASGASKPSAVYFLDAKTGSLKGQVVLPDTSGMGIGAIAVLDTNKDNIADIVYAADRNGDVWRIKLDPVLENSVAHKLWDGSPNQPITGEIALHRVKSGEYIVLFGTGSDLLSSDKLDTTQQSFYGIRDDLSQDNSYSTVDKMAAGRLLKQEIVENKEVNGETYRKVSQHSLPTDGSKSGGWFVDLSVGTVSAERVTQPFIVLAGGVFFTTQIPSLGNINRCQSSFGESWVMMLSAETGAAPLQPVIEPKTVNFTSGTSTVAGYKSDNGNLFSVVTVISSENNGAWQDYQSTGGMINNQLNYASDIIQPGMQLYASKPGLSNKPLIPGTGIDTGYRISWREVRDS